MRTQITGIAVAAFFSVTSAALAQTQPTQTQQPQTPTETKSGDTAATQTFTGCLMTERDYRSAHNLGAGQLGGVGLGDEFVLVDVKVSPAKTAAATAGASDTPSVTTTPSGSPAKCADKGTAYRVMGSTEEQLKTLVGRHVEIQGRFKKAEDAAAGATRPDEKLPAEIEILSFREAPAPAPAGEPAMAQRPAQTVTPPSPPVTAPAPAASTVDPARGQAPDPTTTTPRRELPATASSTALMALIGVVALSSGLALTIIRRRIL